MPLAEHVQVGTSLVDAVSAWLAESTPTESPVPGPEINTPGIRNFIITKIVPILLGVLGVPRNSSSRTRPLDLARYRPLG